MTSFNEKLTPKAAAVLGEPVLATCLVQAPGATLYGSYAPSASMMGLGGEIGTALASKLGSKKLDGMAGTVPRQQGLLALTEGHLVFLRKKTFGNAPSKELERWPRADVELSYEHAEGWPYPGLGIRFGDGSVSMMFGEQDWGFQEIVAASGA